MSLFTILQPTEVAQETNIAWAHHTLNFWTGCNHVSPECDSCYAETDMNNKNRNFNIVRRTSTDQWEKAYALNQTAARQGECALVFTCSYSDFFHERADVWRPKAWQVIRECQNLVWLVLTKRSDRVNAHLPPDWSNGYPNVWLGVTVGVKASYHRLDELRKVPAVRRFISIEPLLESVADMDLTGFDWPLVGGMSGVTWGTNRMKLAWAAEVYERSKQHPNCHYFFKQMSAFKSERGIDGLSRYLGVPDLLRSVPPTQLPLMPLSIEKGHRLTDKEWEDYED
jgi:protein gp37